MQPTLNQSEMLHCRQYPTKFLILWKILPPDQGLFRAPGVKSLWSIWDLRDAPTVYRLLTSGCRVETCDVTGSFPQLSPHLTQCETLARVHPATCLRFSFVVQQGKSYYIFFCSVSVPRIIKKQPIDYVCCYLTTYTMVMNAVSMHRVAFYRTETNSFWCNLFCLQWWNSKDAHNRSVCIVTQYGVCVSLWSPLHLYLCWQHKYIYHTHITHSLNGKVYMHMYVYGSIWSQLLKSETTFLLESVSTHTHTCWYTHTDAHTPQQMIHWGEIYLWLCCPEARLLRVGMVIYIMLWPHILFDGLGLSRRLWRTLR